MSDLLLIHRAFSNEKSSQAIVPETGIEDQSHPDALVWKTCLRQIFFFDKNDPAQFQLQKGDEVYTGHDAESFLAQVLCGLKSPLIGETEVFGQFKLWWKSLPDEHSLKMRFQGRIETLYALVKTVREKVLCGQGSQSYGSLLRRHLSSPVTVDILGAGHLVQEIAPWLERKSPYRIWCRDTSKVQATEWGQKAQALFHIHEPQVLGEAVIVAAPLSHDELNQWLQKRGFAQHNSLFDFRSDSQHFVPFTKPKLHLKLSDFSSQHEEHRNEIVKKAESAHQMIATWKNQQESRMQVRPYGWDDL